MTGTIEKRADDLARRVTGDELVRMYERAKNEAKRELQRYCDTNAGRTANTASVILPALRKIYRAGAYDALSSSGGEHD